MREIKFRVWDKKLNKFRASKVEKNNGLTGVLVKNGIFTINFSTNDTFVVQQFTGLKDKNGREIYEGDYVKVGGIDGFMAEFPISFECGAFCFTIAYDLTRCWLNGHSNADSGILDDLEVVGNVFENPELRNPIHSIYEQVAKMQTPESQAGVDKLFKNPTEEEIAEIEGLTKCPNCEQKAWDGRICQICGAKDI